MSKSTTSQPASQFAVGELVIITGTGLPWDGQIAAVMSIERVNPLDENDTSFFVERLDEDGQAGRGRGCYLHASQMRPTSQQPAQPQPTSKEPKAPKEKTPKPAPLFDVGQRVKIIANQGDWRYGALIGTAGVISTQRGRRHGFQWYNCAYQNEKGVDSIAIVREDDLESAAPDELVADELIADEVLAPEPPTPASFKVGNRVTVRPPTEGQEEDAYPSFTAYPVVGEIASGPRFYGAGYCYDVRFPRIVNGVSSDWWPPVAIREARLVREPSPVGWMAHEAAMEQHAARMASAKATAKAPETPPLFAKGERVTVDQHSALAYETFTRKGAVGVITEIGKPVRGIRRYTVRYSTGVMTRIREEHLVMAEMPAPPEPHPQPVVETAYVERSDGELVKREQTMLFPVPPQPAPQPHPWPTPEELEQRRAAARAREQQQMAALLALSPHEAARWLAKWLITTDVQRGYTEQMIALGHQGSSGSLGEVAVESGRIVRVHRIGPHPAWTATGDYPAGYDHHEVFSLHALYEELHAKVFEPAKPQQMSLWG